MAQWYRVISYLGLLSPVLLVRSRMQQTSVLTSPCMFVVVTKYGGRVR